MCSSLKWTTPNFTGCLLAPGYWHWSVQAPVAVCVSIPSAMPIVLCYIQGSTEPSEIGVKTRQERESTEILDLMLPWIAYIILPLDYAPPLCFREWWMPLSCCSLWLPKRFCNTRIKPLILSHIKWIPCSEEHTLHTWTLLQLIICLKLVDVCV